MRSAITEAQLREIYRGTIDALYAYASRRCGGMREVAEDVTQETWLRAVQGWRRRGVPDVPLAWLTTVARNLILNRARQRESLSLDDVSPVEDERGWALQRPPRRPALLAQDACDAR